MEEMNISHAFMHMFEYGMSQSLITNVHTNIVHIHTTPCIVKHYQNSPSLPLSLCRSKYRNIKLWNANTTRARERGQIHVTISSVGFFCVSCVCVFVCLLVRCPSLSVRFHLAPPFLQHPPPLFVRCGTHAHVLYFTCNLLVCKTCSS